MLRQGQWSADTLLVVAGVVTERAPFPACVHHGLADDEAARGADELGTD